MNGSCLTATAFFYGFSSKVLRTGVKKNQKLGQFFVVVWLSHATSLVITHWQFDRSSQRNATEWPPLDGEKIESFNKSYVLKIAISALLALRKKRFTNPDKSLGEGD